MRSRHSQSQLQSESWLGPLASGQEDMTTAVRLREALLSSSSSEHKCLAEVWAPDASQHGDVSTVCRACGATMCGRYRREPAQDTRPRPRPWSQVDWLSGYARSYALHDIAGAKDDWSRSFRTEACTMWAREVRAVPRCMREMVAPWIKPRRAEMG